MKVFEQSKELIKKAKELDEFIDKEFFDYEEAESKLDYIWNTQKNELRAMCDIVNPISIDNINFDDIVAECFENIAKEDSVTYNDIIDSIDIEDVLDDVKDILYKKSVECKQWITIEDKNEFIFSIVDTIVVDEDNIEDAVRQVYNKMQYKLLA